MKATVLFFFLMLTGSKINSQAPNNKDNRKENIIAEVPISS